MKFGQFLLLICLMGGAVGCGQKGPLVMPDAPKHKRTVPSLPGAPAKPASGSGASSPAPNGAGSATNPAAPAPAPAPVTPNTPAAADSTHP